MRGDVSRNVWISKCFVRARPGEDRAGFGACYAGLAHPARPLARPFVLGYFLAHSHGMKLAAKDRRMESAKGVGVSMRRGEAVLSAPCRTGRASRAGRTGRARATRTRRTPERW